MLREGQEKCSTHLPPLRWLQQNQKHKVYYTDITMSIRITESITPVPFLGYRCEMGANFLSLWSNFSIFPQYCTWWWVWTLLKERTLKHIKWLPLNLKHGTPLGTSDGKLQIVKQTSHSHLFFRFSCVWAHCLFGSFELVREDKLGGINGARAIILSFRGSAKVWSPWSVLNTTISKICFIE